MAVHRIRPLVNATVQKNIFDALVAEHEKRGGRFAHTVEAVLARGLALDPQPAQPPGEKPRAA